MNKFKFIGQNGSMGFIHGAIYILNTFELGMDGLYHARFSNGVYCPYGSLKKFLDNWEEI